MDQLVVTELWVNDQLIGDVESFYYEYPAEDIYVSGLDKPLISVKSSPLVMVQLVGQEQEMAFYTDQCSVMWIHGGDASDRIMVTGAVLLPETADALIDDKTHRVQDMIRLLPGVLKNAQCPAKCGSEQSIWTVIIHLNDEHKWDRMRIADWLESLDINLEFKEVDNDNDD